MVVRTLQGCIICHLSLQWLLARTPQSEERVYPKASESNPIGDEMAGNSNPLVPGNTSINPTYSSNLYNNSFPLLSHFVPSLQDNLNWLEDVLSDAIITTSTPLPSRMNLVFQTPNNGSCVTSNVVQHTDTSMPILVLIMLYPRPVLLHFFIPCRVMIRQRIDKLCLMLRMLDIFVNMHHKPPRQS